MQSTSLTRAAALIALACLALAGCSGGGDYEQPPPAPVAEATEVPISAVASSRAFTDYAAALAPSDSAEALGLGALGDASPVDDSGEPLPIG
ncbi:hypothetical protein [Rivibacter subsaxonicus]|uniref:Uncharacterized protein n=1 Tax=Rivibacter subsaxonicus TaxID=457575 RepID=A0A4Q7VVN1_9BURK|nr:hypothetical protein [Rivibacter subsaxonicus]RZU00555.1 hypothetical protein EV670_1265 [Rivibacter subsaxonicus]